MGTATGFGVGARRRAVLGVGAVLALVAPGVGLAADPDLAMNRTEIVGEQTGWDPPFFGWRGGGGDFDGDGFADLATGEPGIDLVLVYSGSPRGMPRSPTATLKATTFTPATDGDYGISFAVADMNADGYDDLGVGVNGSAGQFAVYLGGPGGPGVESERVFSRPVDGVESDDRDFAQSASSGGDMDGDGYEEMLVADPYWGDDPSSHVAPRGALFVYSGGPNGPDPCPHLLANRLVADANYSRAFGTIGSGDLNGDGYSDAAASCLQCATGGRSPYLFALGAVDWNIEVESGDLDAYVAAVAGDLDADGFADLALTSWGGDILPDAEGGTVIVYGSPSGPDPSAATWIAEESLDLGSAGDVDADGFDDLALIEDEGVRILFGSPTHVEAPSSRWLPVTPTESGYTVAATVVGAFDMNGDGRSEVVIGDGDYWDGKGRLLVDSPVCTWYADADADGHGDPAVTQATCHDAGAGWVAVPDDCDDADAARSGSVWFPDTDGDGYGTGQGVLACEQPANTATENHDCDDADPAVSPAAEDSAADDVDQDCDGHDGPWTLDTGGDCPDLYVTDTGDTAETADTADTATTDTADTSAANDDTGHGSPRDPGCGCNTPASPGAPAAGALLALAAAFASRRRA